MLGLVAIYDIDVPIYHHRCAASQHRYMSFRVSAGTSLIWERQLARASEESAFPGQNCALSEDVWWLDLMTTALDLGHWRGST